MTGRGITLTVALGLLLLFALGSGMRIVYYLVFFIALLWLYAFASTLLAACRLRCHQSLDTDNVIRGDATGLHVQLTGTLVLPVVMQVRASVPVPGEAAASDRTMTLLPGRRTRHIDWDLPCPHRGVWEARVDRLQVSDLFGLFTMPLYGKDAIRGDIASVVVYPRLHELDGEVPPVAMLAQEATQQSVIQDQGSSFAGTRDYRCGDSLKRIHWKQTVRTQKMHTRQYEIASEQYTLMYLDPFAPSTTDLYGYADLATECLCALSWFYLQAGQPIRLWSVGEQTITLSCTQEEEFDTLHAHLATLPFEVADVPMTTTDWTADRLDSVSAVFVMTSRPSPELLGFLEELSYQHYRVFCMCPSSPESQQLAAVCPDGIRLLLVDRPEDIFTQLGDCL